MAGSRYFAAVRSTQGAAFAHVLQAGTCNQGQDWDWLTDSEGNRRRDVPEPAVSEDGADEPFEWPDGSAIVVQAHMAWDFGFHRNELDRRDAGGDLSRRGLRSQVHVARHAKLTGQPTGGFRRPPALETRERNPWEVHHMPRWATSAGRPAPSVMPATARRTPRPKGNPVPRRPFRSRRLPRRFPGPWPISSVNPSPGTRPGPTREILERLDERLAGSIPTDHGLAEYLGELYDQGQAPNSIALVVSAVRFRAKLQGLDSPVGPVTSRALAGIRRAGKDRRQGQVQGVGFAAADAAAAVAGGDRRGSARPYGTPP